MSIAEFSESWNVGKLGYTTNTKTPIRNVRLADLRRAISSATGRMKPELKESNTKRKRHLCLCSDVISALFFQCGILRFVIHELIHLERP